MYRWFVYLYLEHCPDKDNSNKPVPNNLVFWARFSVPLMLVD